MIKDFKEKMMGKLRDFVGITELDREVRTLQIRVAELERSARVEKDTTTLFKLPRKSHVS